MATSTPTVVAATAVAAAAMSNNEQLRVVLDRCVVEFSAHLLGGFVSTAPEGAESPSLLVFPVCLAFCTEVKCMAHPEAMRL